MLERSFYLKDATLVAPALLGKVLVHKCDSGITKGMIVETEAYRGAEDKGSHSYLNKRTPRTEIQFGLGGYAYVYMIYGKSYCFNVVTGRENSPEVVFIRALQPLIGIELMQQQRGVQRSQDLCNGPGKLCTAMGISKANYGEDLCGNQLYIEDYLTLSPTQIGVSARINIDYAEECKDYNWRYFIKDNPFVSKVAKRYNSNLTLDKV